MFQQVIAIIGWVVFTSEATQAIFGLRMYMDSDPPSVVSCRGMQPGTEPTIHSWLHPSTTKHTERIVIHIHPQYRY
jgi:hypothetical protein